MYQGILPTLFVAYSFNLFYISRFRQYISLSVLKNSLDFLFISKIMIYFLVLTNFSLLKIFKVFFAFLYFLKKLF